MTPTPRTIGKQRELLGGGPGDIPIVHTLYDVYVFWSDVLTIVPKTQRHTLGNQISKCLLEIITLFITAASCVELEAKRESLKRASAQVDLVKLLIRLAKDSKSIGNNQYLHLQSELNKTGKMLGGWIKHIEDNKGA